MGRTIPRHAVCVRALPCCHPTEVAKRHTRSWNQSNRLRHRVLRSRLASCSSTDAAKLIRRKRGYVKAWWQQPEERLTLSSMSSMGGKNVASNTKTLWLEQGTTKPKNRQALGVRMAHRVGQRSNFCGRLKTRSSAREEALDVRRDRQSPLFQEPQGEGKEHQNDTNVHHKAFPESTPEKQYVDGDYDSYHGHNNNDRCRSCHNTNTLCAVVGEVKMRCSAGRIRTCGQMVNRRLLCR